MKIWIKQGEEKTPKPPPCLGFFASFFLTPRCHKCPKKEACALGFLKGPREASIHVWNPKIGGGKTSGLSKVGKTFGNIFCFFLFYRFIDIKQQHQLSKDSFFHHILYVSSHPSTLQGISPMDWVGYTDFRSRKYKQQIHQVIPKDMLLGSTSRWFQNLKIFGMRRMMPPSWRWNFWSNGGAKNE